ncbi:MAG: glutamate racemase [Parcubacteria group bacterium]|nr:glutamate racemase [Parcubacteria group bacterium]
MKIGIFDSGFGGLTVFRHIAKKFPMYDFIYLGDNARAPYGNKSCEAVCELSEKAVDFLFAQSCQIIIIACNTISAQALRTLQQSYLKKKQDASKRILGVLIPMAEEAVHISKRGRIGIIGTTGTIESKAFERELRKNFDVHKAELPYKRLSLFTQACPLLVPLVEEGWEKSPVAMKVLRKYLRPLKDKKIDTLILGCTHYPVFLKNIRQIMGKNCHVPDPGEIIADSLGNYLQRHPEIESVLSKKGHIQMLTTDGTKKFNEIGSRFFGKNIRSEKVSL